jgi:hypothetical protein
MAGVMRDINMEMKIWLVEFVEELMVSGSGLIVVNL